MKKVVSLWIFVSLLPVGIAFLFSASSFAQAVQVARYEREHGSSDQDFIIIPMADKGMILLRDKDKFKDGNKLWEVIGLSTDLTETWNLDMDVEARLRLVGYDYKDDLIYILFRTSEHEGSDLELFTIHVHTREIKRFTIKQQLTFKVTHLGVLKREIVLGGYVSNDPAILIYDLETENLKIVPGFFISDTELLDLRINANNTFNTIVIDRNVKEKKRLILKTFDATGALLLDDEIRIDEKKSILSALSSTLVNDELLITGTWTMGMSKMASGIFSVLADPFADQAINYYDFGQLKFFLDHLSKKRVEKLKANSLQAKNLGSVPDFKTYATAMRLEESPEGFALLAEIYQPASNFNSNPYGPGFSSPYMYGNPYSYNPFMSRYYSPPYQFNSAPSLVGEAKVLQSSVICFDLTGKLTNDYGLVLEDKKTSGIEQTSDFIFNKGSVAIAYKKEKEIRVMRGTPDENDYDTLQSTLRKPEEIVRSDSDNGHVRFWYGTNLYSWGYQHIKDQEKQSEDTHRNVFYINKIKID